MEQHGSNTSVRKELRGVAQVGELTSVADLRYGVRRLVESTPNAAFCQEQNEAALSNIVYRTDIKY